MYVYIYICIERERERDVCIYIYIHMCIYAHIHMREARHRIVNRRTYPRGGSKPKKKLREKRAPPDISVGYGQFSN